MFFERLFKRLNAAKVKYLVIGGVAVNLHGYSRVTVDLDILISLEPSNVRRFVDMIKRLGWKPRVTVDVEAFTDSVERYRLPKGQVKSRSIGKLQTALRLKQSKRDTLTLTCLQNTVLDGSG